MIFTLNNLEKFIKDFADGNFFVETYKYGNFLNAISEKNLKYPVFVADFRGGNLSKVNTSTQQLPVPMHRRSIWI